MEFLSKENILASAREFSFKSGNKNCTLLHLANSLLHAKDSLLWLALHTLGGDALNNVVSHMNEEIKQYKRVNIHGANEVMLSPGVKKLFSKLSYVESDDLDISYLKLLESLVDSPQIRGVLCLAGVDHLKLINQIESVCDFHFPLQIHCQPIGQSGKIEWAVEREKEVKEVINILVQNTSNKNALLIGDKWDVNRLIEGVVYQILSGNAGGLDGTKVLALNINSVMTNINNRSHFSLRLKRVFSAAEESKQKLVLFIDQIHLLFKPQSITSTRELLLRFLSSGKVTFIGATTMKDYHMVVQDDSELNGYFTRMFVPETSQNDSIDILKGRKQKLVKLYNVEIPNRILKYTVRVSHRYAPGQLPLKAINLLDRACAMVSQEFYGEVDEVARLRIVIIGLENELASLEDLEESRRPQLMELLHSKRNELDLLQKNCKQEREKISDIHAMKHLKRISDELTDTHNMDPVVKAKRAKILEGYAAKILKVESELCGVARLTLTVGEEHVARALSELTGIPLSNFGKTAMEKVKFLKDSLNSQIVDQEEAVTAVCEVVKGTLYEDNKKPGSLLFMGTTGVGKTEMATALTEHLCGDQSSMIRFDMNEFSQSNSVTRFFGPPPGYKGYKEEGQLTQAVRKKPFCVILLDEFDKASTKIQQSLLRVLDEGEMMDCHGTANFRNTVIIMTSNVGATHLMNSISEKGSFVSASKRVIAEVNQRFSKELIARVGEIVVFNPMSNELVEKIIVKEIEKRKAEFATRGALLEITEEAKDYIVNQAFKAGTSVRVVKAWIEKHVDRVLKDYFLEQIIDKSSSVEVSVKETGEGLRFDKINKT